MKDERELLEKLEDFNDKKMKNRYFWKFYFFRVKQGKSKRIPLGEQPQNYSQSYKKYKGGVKREELWDSEDEEIIMRNRN